MFSLCDGCPYLYLFARTPDILLMCHLVTVMLSVQPQYMHINYITSDMGSEIRLFTDDFVCYREIKKKEDTLKLSKISIV